MEVFEFQINPRLKKEFLMESFYFAPKNFYEKKLGFLFCVGELKNAPPKKSTFLSQLAIFLRENFYKNFSKKREAAFKDLLVLANDFFDQLLKKGEDFWCFNLNFFICNLKQTEFLFSKTGEFKVSIFRAGKLYDLEKKLKGKTPTLKVFDKIAKGKLKERDTLFVLNKELFRTLEKEKIFSHSLFLNEEILRNKIKEKEESLKNSTGIIFGIYVKKTKVFEPLKKEKFEVKKILKNLSLKTNFFQKIHSLSSNPKILLWLLLLFVLLLGKIILK